MAISGLTPVIPVLTGERIVHTAPGYGPGQIQQAYVKNNSEIYVIIKFDNGRQANPFSLIPCMNRGLITLNNSSFSEETLNKIMADKVRVMQEAKREEDECKRREEEERRQAIFREQERQRREAERRAAERQAAEQKERERQDREKKRVFDYLSEERNVQFFVHFTPVTNLQSILSHGIMPRSVLSEKGIPADTPDVQRFDFRMDYSSFSISFPNYRIFYSKRMNTPFKYAVLIIDPQLILDLPLSSISYLPNNAASGAIQNVEEYTGLEAAKAMFQETVQVGKTEVTREQLGLPEFFTTNPQAEVFIRSTIAPKYIRSIITIDSEQANQVRRQLQASPVPVPKIIYNREFYKPRNDWCFWSAQTDSLEE